MDKKEYLIKDWYGRYTTCTECGERVDFIKFNKCPSCGGKLDIDDSLDHFVEEELERAAKENVRPIWDNRPGLVSTSWNG